MREQRNNTLALLETCKVVSHTSSHSLTTTHILLYPARRYLVKNTPQNPSKTLEKTTKTDHAKVFSIFFSLLILNITIKGASRAQRNDNKKHLLTNQPTNRKHPPPESERNAPHNRSAPTNRKTLTAKPHPPTNQTQQTLLNEKQTEKLTH